jgi:membrane associated rhomboid family serine protease
LVFGIIPVQAPLLIGIYTVMELFNQVSGTSGGVAHLTHLAGFGFAYLYFIFRLRINPLDEWRRNRRH